MNYSKLVGEKLREIRKKKGYSLKLVEDKTMGNFKASTLGAYERGQRNLSIQHVWELARFYDVNPDELIRVEKETSNRRDRVNLKIIPDLSDTDKTLLHNYIKYIDNKRKEFDWNVRSLRQSDILSLAHLVDVTPDVISDKLGQIVQH